MYKCKILDLCFIIRTVRSKIAFYGQKDLLDTNVLYSEQSVPKLDFMVKRDSKVSSPIWDFSENQILLDIEKTNEKSSNFRMFL